MSARPGPNATPGPLDVLVTGSSARFASRFESVLRERGHHVRHVESDQPEALPPVPAAAVGPDGRATLRELAASADVTVLLTGLGPLSAAVDDGLALSDVLGHARPGSDLIEVSTLSLFGDHGAQVADESCEPGVPAGLEPARVSEVRTLAADDWLRAVVLRVGLVIADGGGPVIHTAVAVAQEQGTSGYVGEAHDVWPTIHVDDLLPLLVALVEDEQARGTYHAVTGHTTARELASLIAHVAGVTDVGPEPARAGAAGSTASPLPRVNVRATSTRTAELGVTATAPGLAEVLGGVRT